MTTPNEANEAGLEAAAQRPTKTAQGDLGRVEVLAKDSKAARIIAKAEAKRLEAEASVAAQDAEAERRIRLELAQLEAQASKAVRKEEKAARKAARKAASRAKVTTWAAGMLAHVRSEAAASYAAFIYIIVVAVALHSQAKTFKTLFDWGLPWNVVGSLFVEGAGLAFIATSIAMRLEGRSGWWPRLLGWVVTLFAAFINYNAYASHKVGDVPLMAISMAASSIVAMLLLEVRTAHKVAQKLEDVDQKDKPQARLGLRFCLRYPSQAWWAFSAMIAMPSVRTRTKALRAGRSMAHLRRKAKLNEYLIAEAKKSLRAAQRKAGTSEAILARLTELAHLGLDGLGLQAQLAAVAQDVSGPKAEPPAPAQTVEAERPKTKKAPASGPRPAAQPSAQPERPKAEPETKADRPSASFAEWAEAENWAARPGGLDSWIRRVAFLAACYPTEIPPRAKVIEEMKLRVMDPDQSNPEHSWTNKGHVGWALADLKALRAEGYLDPIAEPQTEKEMS